MSLKGVGVKGQKPFPKWYDINLPKGALKLFC